MADQTQNYKNLWAAVLHRGVLDATGDIENKKERLAVSEARYWVFSNSKYLNSFLTICELVGVSSAKIRSGIKAAIKSDMARSNGGSKWQ